MASGAERRLVRGARRAGALRAPGELAELGPGRRQSGARRAEPGGRALVEARPRRARGPDHARRAQALPGRRGLGGARAASRIAAGRARRREEQARVVLDARSGRPLALQARRRAARLERAHQRVFRPSGRGARARKRGVSAGGCSSSGCRRSNRAGLPRGGRAPRRARGVARTLARGGRVCARRCARDWAVRLRPTGAYGLVAWAGERERRDRGAAGRVGRLHARDRCCRGSGSSRG